MTIRPWAVARLASSCSVVHTAVMLVTTLAVVGLAASAAGAVTAPRFSAPVLADSGLVPRAVVAADLNGDGKPDLVTTDALADKVSVLAGNGDGSFHRPVRLAARSASHVAVGDVSDDGRPDLIVLGQAREGDVITVLLNEGEGKFVRDRVYALAPTRDPTRVALGDVDGNGIVDVVAAGMPGRDLVVLPGIGAGQFGTLRKVSGRSAGVPGLALADFNADGRLDAALPADSALVTVRLGQADGMFGPARTFGRSKFSAVDVTTADLNHDGTPDLALAMEQGGVGVLLGNGDGTFTTQSYYPGPAWTEAVLTADFDGDGKWDIAASGLTIAPLSLRLGRGDGTFQAEQSLPSLHRYFDTKMTFVAEGTVSDFNLDGRSDVALIAAAGWADLSATVVLLNWTGLPASPCVVVPVVREPMRRARRHLRNAGCRVGHVRYRYSRKARRGRVVSQRPRRGSVLATHATVDVVVSRGRRR